MRRFTSSADRLVAALDGLSEADLDLSLAPGEWSIRQIVHHLADDCDVWSFHLKKAIATPGTPIRFEGFPGNEAWANALAFEKRSIEPAVELIKAHRRLLAQILEYTPDAWDGHVKIVDPQGKEVQKVSARDMVRFLTEHMEEHVGVIEAIKEKYGV